MGRANCASLPTVTASNVANLLPANTYYYKGSGNLLEVTAPNATWSHLNFANWQIYDGTEPNFTLDDDCISFTGNGSAEQTIITAAAGAANLKLENSTIFSTGAGGQSANAVNAVGNVLLNDDYIYNTTDAVYMGSGSTIENSYITTNADVAGAHAEDVYIDDGTATITHNTLLNPQLQTATIFAEDDAASCDNRLTVTGNLLAGGGYVIYSCSGTGGAGSSLLDFSDNDVGRCLGQRASYDGGSYCGATPPTGGDAAGAGQDASGYWPNGGFFGVAADTFCQDKANVSWSGNHWDDNGASVACG